MLRTYFSIYQPHHNMAPRRAYGTAVDTAETFGVVRLKETFVTCSSYQRCVGRIFSTGKMGNQTAMAIASASLALTTTTTSGGGGMIGIAPNPILPSAKWLAVSVSVKMCLHQLHRKTRVQSVEHKR